MGLLTDPGATKNLSDKIEKFGKKIGYLGYFAGLVWLVAQSTSEFNAKIYIDENALLPGLATPTFSIGNEALSKQVNKEISSCDTPDCQLSLLKVDLYIKIF